MYIRHIHTQNRNDAKLQDFIGSSRAQVQCAPSHDQTHLLSVFIAISWIYIHCQISHWNKLSWQAGSSTKISFSCVGSITVLKNRDRYTNRIKGGWTLDALQSEIEKIYRYICWDAFGAVCLKLSFKNVITILVNTPLIYHEVIYWKMYFDCASKVYLAAYPKLTDIVHSLENKLVILLFLDHRSTSWATLTCENNYKVCHC